ncbi:MAG TPA: bifunctional oligoribonuclease/PAP phosphatase NrnA [Firmicutes bacterium]|nr:bifunctional oligoribonuclease/PAP phosphatase NrnA [Bacillota bacterium]
MNKKQAADILSAVKRSERILLTTHVNPDGDGLGSGLALACKLMKMGKKVDFINADPIPRIYDFLPHSAMIKNRKKVAGCYDLVIFLECPDLERNGHIIDHLRQARCVINIDHHLGNSFYGDINVVDPKAAAVGVQLVKFMELVGWKIDSDMAKCLYTAVITDTGSFNYSNTTPEVHRIAGKLIHAGARPVDISAEVYSTTVSSTKLLQKMLKEMKVKGKIGYSVITRKMLRDTNALESEADNFINSIRAIRGVEVAVLFKERDSKTVKISFRSKKGVDVNIIAAELNGGGHKYASGCMLEKNINDAVKLVLSKIRKYYRTRKNENNKKH